MNKWLAVFVLGLSGIYSAFAGQYEYNDCLLRYLKGARHDAAASMIQMACYENYYGPFEPGEKVRKYNDCLLEHLTDVESFQAVMEIRNACAGKYLF